MRSINEESTDELRRRLATLVRQADMLKRSIQVIRLELGEREAMGLAHRRRAMAAAVRGGVGCVP